MLLMVGDGGRDGVRGELGKLHKEVLRNPTGTGSEGEGGGAGIVRTFIKQRYDELTHSTGNIHVCVCLIWVGWYG